jgi:hypothetical protein
LVTGPDGGLTPGQTGRLTAGLKITLTLRVVPLTEYRRSCYRTGWLVVAAAGRMLSLFAVCVADRKMAGTACSSVKLDEVNNTPPINLLRLPITVVVLILIIIIILLWLCTQHILRDRMNTR